MAETVERCDRALAKRLQSVLTARNLVDVRNDLEMRVTTYFETNIGEQNLLQSRKYAHQLLEALYMKYEE